MMLIPSGIEWREMCRGEIIDTVRNVQNKNIYPHAGFYWREMMDRGEHWNTLADYADRVGEPTVARFYRAAARAYDAATC